MSPPKNTLKPSLEEGSPLASGTITSLKSEVLVPLTTFADSNSFEYIFAYLNSLEPFFL